MLLLLPQQWWSLAILELRWTEGCFWEQCDEEEEEEAAALLAGGRGEEEGEGRPSVEAACILIWNSNLWVVIKRVASECLRERERDRKK